MLTYHFPNHLHISMYEYLYQCIKEDIIHQKLNPHEKLPSKRTFAKHLKVSLMTIENAYNQLLIEGYIYSIEKKGYFVSEIDFPKFHVIQKPTILEKENPIYTIDLKNNSISPDAFPFSIWSKLTREVLSTKSSQLLTRAPQNGCLVLREAIAKHLYAFSGIQVSPAQIIIGAGTEYLYNLVIQLLGRDYIYALENPGHRSIAKVYQLNNVSYQYISLDHYGLNIQELSESPAQIVHLSAAHHFPTGITMPIKRRLDILNWAYHNHGYIIEDDYDSEFRLRGKPIPSLLQIDQHQSVIYMNTFSKTLAPSFRISYMVLPPKLLERYQSQFYFYTCSVSSLEQIVLAKFISEGYFEKHLRRMKNAYKMIRDEFLDQLSHSPIYPSIIITEENAGLHFIIQHHLHITDQELVDKAKKIGLHIATLSDYHHKPYLSHRLVINYSGLTKQQIPQAVQLLNQLLNKDIHNNNNHNT